MIWNLTESDYPFIEQKIHDNKYKSEHFHDMTWWIHLNLSLTFENQTHRVENRLGEIDLTERSETNK